MHCWLAALGNLEHQISPVADVPPGPRACPNWSVLFVCFVMHIEEMEILDQVEGQLAADGCVRDLESSCNPPARDAYQDCQCS